MRYPPPYRRPHVAGLTTLLTEQGPMRLVAITGPRQTGKTTLVLQALSDLEGNGIPCWYLPIDDPTPDDPPVGVPPLAHILIPGQTPGPEWLVSTWERARAAAERSSRGLVLVLDEIQRIPTGRGSSRASGIETGAPAAHCVWRSWDPLRGQC